MIDGATINIETETAKATTTVKDDTGAVTRTTETETEKQTTVVPVGMMGVPVNVETETAKATTTVKDVTGAVTGSTVSKTEKHFMVVTGPNDAGVAAPVEVRRGTATDRTGRSWQCNRIDLN